MNTGAPNPTPTWVVNQGYDWDHIQHLRILAGEVLHQEGRDDLTRTVAQAVADLCDNLIYRERTVVKALSTQRHAPDVAAPRTRLQAHREQEADR
jgi:hypothetical protein